MQSQLQRIPSSQLRLNTALPWSLYDEAGHLLLGRGNVLERNDKIDEQMKRGVFVEQSELKQYNYPSAAPGSVARAAQASTAAAPPVRVDPFRLRETLSTRLTALLREVAKEADYSTKVAEMAAMVSTLVDNHPEAMLASIFFLDHAKYPIAHSIDTALLTNILARKLDWTDAQRNSALCAALTMNIGMIDAQTILFLQRQPPTDIQKSMIAAHPNVGTNMLRAAGVTDELWLQIVEDHHQVPDGSGYPGGKKDIAPEATLLRTLDIYTALLSPRPTRKAVDPGVAAKTLFVQETKHNNNLVGLLIKEIGLYPPGSYVKLKNGEMAIVSRRATANTAVMAHTFMSTKNLPIIEPLPRDTSRMEYTIVSGIARDAISPKNDFTKLWMSSGR